MRFVFIDAEKALYPLRILCQVLEVSRSGYYACERGPQPEARHECAEHRRHGVDRHRRRERASRRPGRSAHRHRSQRRARAAAEKA
jgi:hypothetical protein